VDTGLHALDGARWLRRAGFDERVTVLVTYHSCARIEADERGLRDDLVAEFAREQSPKADLLLYCDMTTGPDGQDMDLRERLAEIRRRYGSRDVVTVFVDRAAGEILAAVSRAEALLRANRIGPASQDTA
jgi:hypothetical protein